MNLTLEEMRRASLAYHQEREAAEKAAQMVETAPVTPELLDAAMAGASCVVVSERFTWIGKFPRPGESRPRLRLVE